MERYDLSKETNGEIGKAIGVCVGTVLTALAVEALNKWFGEEK